MGIMEKYDIAKFTLDIGVKLCMLYNLLGQKFRNYDLNISIIYNFIKNIHTCTKNRKLINERLKGRICCCQPIFLLCPLFLLNPDATVPWSAMR